MKSGNVAETHIRANGLGHAQDGAGGVDARKNASEQAPSGWSAAAGKAATDAVTAAAPMGSAAATTTAASTTVADTAAIVTAVHAATAAVAAGLPSRQPL